jgi:ribosomal protein S18 acetylase RimI-like enzyme
MTNLSKQLITSQSGNYFEFKFKGDIPGLIELCCNITIQDGVKVAGINQITIDSRYQKQGLGRSTVTELENILKELGAEKVELNSARSNVGFWKKLGYKGRIRPYGMTHFEKILGLPA